MKIFALLSVLFAGLGYAADEQLTLSKPSGGSLGLGESVVSWTDKYEVLTSWKISFTLNNTLSATDVLFFSSYAYGPRPDCVSLSLDAEGKISIGSGNEILYTSSSSWVNIGTPVDVTLQFVSLLDSNNQIVGGEIFTQVGDNSIYLEVKASSVKDKYLYNLTNNPQPLLNANSGVLKYTNVQLYKLDDRMLIPEPTTTTMNLLALVALASRRRRR